MRKRLLAFIIAAAMVFESVPVSASEISHEGETVELSVEETTIAETSVDETAIEETTIAETFVKETTIEEPSVKETLTESGAADPAAPEEEKTEERSKEDKTQSVEDGQEKTEKPETDSTEVASETGTAAGAESGKENGITETETGSQTESEVESESETESMSQEPLSEPDYEKYPNGVIPFEIDGTDIFAGLNTSLYTRGIENRAKYDPRVDAPEEVTEVKNQNPWGTCWSFAAMACLENAAIRQGLADNSIDLSERHLVYFATQTGFDKLGNANDDTIVSNLEEALMTGGNAHYAATKLMNWHGAALEEKYPYSRNLASMKVSQSDAQGIELMAHDVYFIPTKSAAKNERVTAIKKLIAEYGCVGWSYANHGDFYNEDTFAYYNPKTYSETIDYVGENVGHAITVIGWDDNFSRENFGNSKAATVYKPGSNGAWIVKNSWGDDWGDNGYFYISYEDASLGSGNSASVMVAAEKKEYDNNYFYGNTINNGGGYSTKKAAQVYQIKGGANTEKLTAVSIMLSSDKVEYSLQVYKNPKLVDGIVKDPESGTAMLKEAVTGKTGYAGLYTIDLPKSVAFSKGDWMSIVFTFTDSANIYTDKSGTLHEKVCTNTTHAGQSFRLSGSTWKDVHDSEYNYRINALTVDDVHQVTFLDAYGNQISVQTVDGGKDAVPPTEPERNGYTFKGWSGSYQNITKDTKLTAEYEPITYSITYQLNGGTAASENPSSYTVETETIVLAEPVRDGYFFAGWYEQGDFSGTPIVSILKGSAGNKTLYAKWEEDTAALAKPVVIPQGIVEEGQPITIKAPKDADIYYTLDGTTPTIKKGIKYTNPFTISKDVTIKAIAVRNGELSEVAQASCQYYALQLVFAEKTTDLWNMRSKKLAFSQIPTTKSEADVTWSTSDKKIVTVSKDGTITGVAVGTATITAKIKNGKGDVVTANCRVNVKKADDIASGSYKNIVWYIDSDGQLIVMGKGDFSSDHYYNSRAPWYEYREKILSAEINVTGITDTGYMFNDCSNLTKVNIRGLKTDQVTDMRGMFSGCSSLTNLDLSGFQTDQVMDMNFMFDGCSSLTNLDLSGFQTGQVTTMWRMFNGCSSLTNLDLSSFQTDKVTDMRYMFSNCRNLTNLDVSGFETAQVTNVDYMFLGCYKLTELNLSNFDLSNAGETVKTMFPTISNLKTIHTPRNLKQSIPLTAKANYTWRKPDGTIITELPQNSNKSILITQKFSAIEGSYQNIKWKIDENEKLTVTGTGEISSNRSSDRAPWYQYRSSIQSAEIRVTEMKNASYLFYDCSNLTKVDVSGFKTNQVTEMQSMFYNCSSLKEVDVSGFQTNQVTEMGYMFYGCKSLAKVDVSSFRTDEVRNIYYMFNGCNELTNLNLSSFDLSKVTSAVNMLPSDTSNLQTIRTPRNLKQSVPMTAKEKYVWCKQDRTVFTELPQNLSESILLTQKLESGGKYQNIIWEIDENGKLTVTGTGEFSASTGYNRAPWYEYHEQILSAKIKVTDITNTSFMFYNCSNLKEIDISGFKTDKVTNMNGMFNSCKSLTNLDVSGFQTDKVITMSSMFSSCNNLTNLDVSGFQTAQVTSMGSMFSNCSSLTAVDVSDFKTDQVTDMSYMFYGCKNLINLDVSGFQTDQVTHIRYMFYECNELTDLDLSSFDLSKVTLADNMLPSGDASNLQTIRTPRNLNQSVPLTAKDKYVWSKPDWTIVTELPQNLSESILLTQKWETGGKYENIIWEIDENGKLTVTGTGEFSASTGLNRAPWYNHREEILSAEIKVTGLQNAACMFRNCSNLTKINLSGFNTDQVTNMAGMFWNCSSLTAIDVSGFQTNQVISMMSMFEGCNNLTKLDLSGFKTAQVTDMASMFYGCSNLAALNVSGFETGQVTDMSAMFDGCSSLTALNVSGFETGQVTNMSAMFNGCSSLTKLDLSSFETGQVTDMSAMFNGCSSLTELDLSSFNTAQVTEIDSMFDGCDELIDLNLSSFDLGSVNGIVLNMLPNSDNFKLQTIRTPRSLKQSISLPVKTNYIWCKEDGTIITELPQNMSESILLTKKWSVGGTYQDITWEIDKNGKLTVTGTGDFSAFTGENRVPWDKHREVIRSAEIKVTDITDLSYMFYDCSNLTKVDLSGLKTDKVTNMSSMFDGCSSLTEVDLSGLKTDQATNISSMFQGCNALTNLDLSSFDLGNVTEPIDNMLPDSPNLQTIHTPRNLKGSIGLPAEDGKAWYQEDETEIVQLPKNLEQSILITKKDKQKETFYKVTFDLKGHGTKIEEIEVKKGEKITEPSKPEAKGYNFTGWYKETECKILWNFESDTVEADITLYAGWEKIKTDPVETVYKVTFDLKGHGTKIETIEVKKGEKITEPPKPEAEGYTFMGWYKDAACRTLWNFEKDTVKKNTTLYAGWKKKGDSENPYEPPEDMSDGFWIAPIEDCTYTGMAITPAVHVYYNKQKLIAGRDYTLTYRNNTKAAGAAEQKAPQVCVKGKGNYSGTAKRSFTIAKAQLTEENLKAAEIYGANIKYTPIVALDGNVLKAKTDYTLLYLDANGGMILKKQPTTIGSYQMRIIGKGSCEGQIDFSYSIAANGGANAIDKGTATVGDMIYDGIEPQVALVVNGRVLERNTDYIVNFVNTNKKGTATAVFFGIGSYAGTLKTKFKVQAAPIQMEDVKSDTSVMYEKGGAKPNPTVTVNGTELVAGRDYKVTYKNNTKIGYAEFTVKGIGNYTGNLTGAFQVEPKKLTAEGVKIYVSDVAYGKKPDVMVYDSNGKKLSANSDYTVFIENAARNVFITSGKNGLYKTQEPITIAYRELEKDRQVTSVKLNKKAVGFPKYFEYTGGEVTLEKDWLTVKAGKTVLRNDEFEILSYVNNIEKGTATVIIQGTEGYGGIKVLNFKIKAKGLF